MIQIRSLYSGATTAQSVKDWFKEKRKEDLPVQVEDFIKHCEVAGVNWVGLFSWQYLRPVISPLTSSRQRRTCLDWERLIQTLWAELQAFKMNLQLSLQVLSI